MCRGHADMLPLDIVDVAAISREGGVYLHERHSTYSRRISSIMIDHGSAARCPCAILIFIVVGTVIGSRHLPDAGGRSPRNAGSGGMALIAWIAGGVLSLLGALTFS